jgi:GNAT superfamily N-acetyltransferase
MQIEFLANYPHFAKPLADYHYEEWKNILPWWTQAAALVELRDHTHRRTIPTTLVAVEEDRLLGSASLVHEDLTEADLPGLASLTPWLASVFVVPDRRGQRVGSALVEAVTELAQTLNISRLYLFTAGQQAFYAHLGWTVLRQVKHHGQPGVVMVKELLDIKVIDRL